MSAKKKTQKTSWFKGLQAELRKIVWPDRKTLAKQTTAVVLVSVVHGLLIEVVDVSLDYGLNYLDR